MDRDELLALIDQAACEGWTELDLSSRGLTDLPPEIGRLTRLQTLVLKHNRLTALPAEIGELIELQTLLLGHNRLTALPPEISQLTQLRYLSLGGNELTTLPLEIGQLTKLQTLALRQNKLAALPGQIGQLTKLQSLVLRHNRLTTLPSEIDQLAQLQYLNLGDNQLTVLLLEFSQLTKLHTLRVSGNQLTALPAEIARLFQLQKLYLGGNKLTAVPPEIGQLPQLRHLDLSNNRLAAMPPEVGRVTELRYLNVSGNRLTALPRDIEQLTQLENLNLGGNQLAALPLGIAQLTRLQYLNLRGNPLAILPPEILAKTHEPRAIIDTYLDALAGRRRSLNELKMVLVGQGNVGKTSLVTCLLDGPEAFDLHETKTEGIEIRPWQLPFPADTESRPIRVNVWDFGGQEIMHATHQFFLTRRTLYLLVLDSRLSEAENRLDYWLQIIRSFGGESPVILVGNKVDQQPLDIDQVGIREKHPCIKAIVETSCLTGEGIDALPAGIAEQITSLPHVFDELLASWFDVKDELENMDADYIPYERYVQMCQDAGVTREQSQRTLLGFLHDLGIVLHFPEPRLETTNILNPEWVTQGVYRILNSHALFQNDGVLTWDLVSKILSNEAYPRDKHMFIIDMMRKFELCYPFPGEEQTYLVPDLLPKEERYTGRWNDALAFQVDYNVLPGSVFSRLIVRMHRCIHKHTVWRTGVLLAIDDNEALVRADLADNRITIRVRGRALGRRDLLTRIREQLDAIHHTIQALQADEKVPLPDHPDIPPVDYKWLRDLERAGRTEFTPPGCVDPISVRQILNGVEPPAGRLAREVEPDPRTEYHFYESHIDHIGDIRTHPEERRKQMDPITGAIVAALAAGVTSGAGEVGKKVIAGAYEALKAAIKKKFGQDSKIVQAVAAVEEEPDFKPNQETLAGRVEQENAAEDDELVKLAQDVLEALKETPSGLEAVSKYNIQATDSEIGVIGDDADIKGGIHFGSKGE